MFIFQLFSREQRDLFDLACSRLFMSIDIIMITYAFFKASRRTITPSEYDELFNVTLYADRQSNNFPVPEKVDVYDGFWAVEYYEKWIDLVIMHNHQQVIHTTLNANAWLRRRLFPNCDRAVQPKIDNPECETYWS